MVIDGLATNHIDATVMREIIKLSKLSIRSSSMSLEATFVCGDCFANRQLTVAELREQIRNQSILFLIIRGL